MQDDFKVNPKLTLNLGLRWEGNTGWSEVNGNERSFDPNIINPATNAPGAMWYAITHANGRNTLQRGAWNNWLPRFGFAEKFLTHVDANDASPTRDELSRHVAHPTPQVENG